MLFLQFNLVNHFPLTFIKALINLSLLTKFNMNLKECLISLIFLCMYTTIYLDVTWDSTMTHNGAQNK
ncbi:hypothetical protein A4A49_14666 [Nicotiana attenuata]|uniref:Uncharacterized protein n=1 Tax=Nicotiana attenuata TaxID=49451 RepID=A0A1J6I1S0_NICAT|nr:hypothetical protein A4A49_14666 [Nicotiana attenuata]